MAQKRRVLVEGAVEALNDRNPEAFGAFVHPEMEFHSAIGVLEGGPPSRNVSEFFDLIQGFDAIWSNLRWQVESIREIDDRSFIVFRITGTAVGSGVPLDQRNWQVWTWRDGKILHGVSYLDERAALEAVGLAD